MLDVVKDFAVNSYSLDFLSKKYDLPKGNVVRQIRTFTKNTKNPKVSSLLKEKLAKYILKDFMSYLKSVPEFAREYGMSLKTFIEFVLTSINDANLIPSDNVANRIYIKLVSKDIKIQVKQIPERIINIIALVYISDKRLSQAELATCYNVEGKSIAKILKRGIAEDIVSDDIAEIIFYKTNKHIHPSKEAMNSLETAFKQREITKLRKRISQLEALMENDEQDGINYLTVQNALDKLRNELSLYETNT